MKFITTNNKTNKILKIIFNTNIILDFSKNFNLKQLKIIKRIKLIENLIKLWYNINALM